MTTLHGHWIWFELMTREPARAKAFYEAVVPGWTLTTGHGGDSDYGFITRGDGAMTGGLLTLSAAMIAGGATPGWIGYIGVDDCDAAVAAIEAAGGTCCMPPRDVAMAGRMAMMLDPGGAPFYVMTPAPPPGGGESTAFSPSKPGACSWSELWAADAARETAFYTHLFGWTLPEAMDMGPAGQYQFVAHDGVTFGGIAPAMPGHASGWAHYFRVADIDACAAAVTPGGGALRMGPHEVPGGDWVIMAEDPEGARFCAVGARAGTP